MSQKTAKRLRKMFDLSAPTAYQHHHVKTVMVDTGRIDENGKSVLRPEERINTVCIGERASYQRAKKEVRKC